MTALNFILCVGCVVLASVGQVLLRLVAAEIAGTTQLMGAVFSLSTLLAISVYAGAMLMWLFILGRVPLTVAFPFFGLSFLFVPIFANRIIGDPVSVSTWVGGVIILAGIVVSSVMR